jgi:uncharacterized Zn-binding protein involved in type VI secretion
LDLRNWEHNATSGTPIAGATVEARAASLVSPNTGPVIASTTTDANGMWEFVGLPDSEADIKVIYTGNVWWHKGLTKHNVSAIFYSTPLISSDQFFKTAGFEVTSGGPWTVTAADQGSILGSWRGINGAGSSAAITRETTTVATKSVVSAKIVQTKVAGSLLLYQNLAIPASARGQELVVSFQVHQSLAAAVRAYITDSAGTTYSATSATTGSFVTLTATRTIDAAATAVSAGISVDLSATVYADNGVWSLGSVAPTYGPEYLTAENITSELIAASAVTTAKIADLSVTTAKLADLNVTSGKLAAGTVVSHLGYTPANRAGDTFQGGVMLTRAVDGLAGQGILYFGNSGAVFIYYDATQMSFQGMPVVFTGDVTQYAAASPTTGRIILSNASHVIAWDGTKFTMDGNTVWHSGVDGAGSGLDADTVDTLQATALLARANHTGTQTAATISDFATAGNALWSALAHAHAAGDATTLDGLNSTQFVRLDLGVAQTGNIHLQGNFSATGSKTRVATGRDDAQGYFHALESPEPYFEEFGHAEGSGRVRVDLPADYVNFVKTDDYYITLTPYGRHPVAVVAKQPTYFVVEGLGRDTLPVAFDWRVTARQGDIDVPRLGLP